MVPRRQGAPLCFTSFGPGPDAPAPALGSSRAESTPPGGSWAPPRPRGSAAPPRRRAQAQVRAAGRAHLPDSLGRARPALLGPAPPPPVTCGKSGDTDWCPSETSGQTLLVWTDPLTPSPALETTLSLCPCVSVQAVVLSYLPPPPVTTITPFLLSP